MTTFDPRRPAQRAPTGKRWVYAGGRWDPWTDTLTGGSWVLAEARPLCRSLLKQRPAVIGEHWHWNGDYAQWCSCGRYCPEPSCNPLMPGQRAEAFRREKKWYSYHLLWRRDRETGEMRPPTEDELDAAARVLADVEPGGHWHYDPETGELELLSAAEMRAMYERDW